MGRTAVRTRTSRPPLPRRAKVLHALTAAGVQSPVLTTYEWNMGGPGGRTFTEAALSAGYSEWSGAEWPCEGALEDAGHVLHRGDRDAVYQLGDVVVYAVIGWGWARFQVAGASRGKVSETLAAFQAKYPPLYRDAEGDASVVPVTFWTYTPHGPMSRLRMIDASEWAPIRGNYTGGVRDELDRLMGDEFEPGKGGQLHLWYGPPGTGKTWALRALASQWGAWAEFSYITDPDLFFGDHPDYMIDVLLQDSYETLTSPTDSEVVTEQREGKWRVLILEDTGELLAADAKDSQGQGLSRLLNVMDGMVGQGLRVLGVVTTNDRIEDFHPAVVRPGRCASQVEFGPLSADEATEWLGAEHAGGTLAELYAARGAGAEAFEDDDELVASLREAFAEPVELVRSCPECERRNQHAMTDGSWICESCGHVDSATDGGVAAEIARVAAEHQPGEPGYGQTAWDAERGIVYWIDWDGTSLEEHDAAHEAFLAIPGVECVISEAESIPDEGWWDAVVVYPADPPVWVLERPDGDAALDEVVALASEPLGPFGRPETPPGPQEDAVGLISSVQALVAAQDGKGDGMAAALEALANAHRTTVDGIAALVASAAAQDTTGRGDVLALTLAGVLDAFARRPDPAPSPIHVHVPEQNLSVHVDAPTIEPPRVDVHVPQPAPQPAPVVQLGETHIHVPEQAAPVVNVSPADAAPVHVHVAAAEPPRPRAVRVEYDDDGRKLFVPIEEEEEPDAA